MRTTMLAGAVVTALIILGATVALAQPAQDGDGSGFQPYDHMQGWTNPGWDEMPHEGDEGLWSHEQMHRWMTEQWGDGEGDSRWSHAPMHGSTVDDHRMPGVDADGGWGHMGPDEAGWCHGVQSSA